MQMFSLKNFRAVAIGALLVSSLSGCGGGGGGTTSVTKAASNLPPAVAAVLRGAWTVPNEIVTDNNNLGFQLLAQMRKTDTGKNVFISPVSVALCMEILYNGAAGSTQTAMAQTLNLGTLSTSQLNNDNADLQASLVSTDPAVQLTVANSFWYRKAKNQILQSFVNTNTQYYGSQIGDLAGAPNNVNAWVSSQTNGKITNIVGQEVQNYVAMMVNAVYFKGAWTNPFIPESTVKSTFTLADGVTTVPCSLMEQDSMLPYFKGDHFQAVQLPYGKQRTTMIVFLPDSGVSVDSVIAEINSSSLTSWLPQFISQYGTVSLPKFTSTYTSDLKPVLSALGMGVAFDPNNANFSNMGPALFLDTAVHKTYLSVDEYGTIAAAVTSVGVGVSAAPVDMFKMTVNRPFICAILDKQTGEILFYGAIDSPAI
jgi:serpin B